MENKARIQKVLSDQGILSRRRTEELIKEGRITVNGRPAQPGHPIDIRRDIVAIDGERVWFQKKKKNYYFTGNFFQIIHRLSTLKFAEIRHVYTEKLIEEMVLKVCVFSEYVV